MGTGYIISDCITYFFHWLFNSAFASSVHGLLSAPW
jgi:hypothetical protein